VKFRKKFCIEGASDIKSGEKLMPGYKAHLAGGFVAFLIVLLLFVTYASGGRVIEWLICALLGSLFPDIDTKSKGQRIWYQLLVIVYVILLILRRWTTMIIVSFLAIIPMLVKHRGLFHHAWFILFLTTCAVGCCYWCAPHFVHLACWDSLFFVAGAWSHLILDRGVRRAFRF
jgi:hypothetical protein